MIRHTILALAVIATPAFAGDEAELTDREFLMPSRNIGCIVQDVSLEGGSGPSKRLYCVRYEPTTIAVLMDERGIESYATEGDQPFSSEANMLHYGSNWFNSGFSCDSTKTGLVCSHASYGGFELSRKGLKKFE